MSERETRNREFKQEITNSFLKTVSAFANYDGGVILFGVADDGKIVGLEDPEQGALSIEHKIHDCIDPQPDYRISIDDDGVVTLNVYKGTQTPYLCGSKAYKRSGTSTAQVDSTELRRLVLAGENLTFDELPFSGNSLQFVNLGQWFSEKLGVEFITDDILKTLGLLTFANEYTNAGALLADKNSFPGVDMARFGSNVNFILERTIVEGVSILSMYETALTVFRRYYQYEEIVGSERVKHERIPEVAFREAMANALVHRTWDVSAHIRVAMYDDHIEVVSPGGLPAGLSKTDYLEGELSLLRNPIIGNVFFRLGLIEQFGTGVRRIRESYAYSQVLPDFRVSETTISVVLPVMDKVLDLTDDEERVLTALSGMRSLSSREIADRLSFGKDKTLRLLKTLVDLHLVEIQGTGRSTRYGLVKR